jgi:hypothetical protein
MRHLATLGILPLVLLSTLPAHAQMVTISPEQIGQIFCIGSLGNDMAPVEALLTPDLAAVVADAWVKDAQAEAANPGDKPPLGDGLPWRSWPDYADGCAVSEVTTEAGAAHVHIGYTFAEYPEANYDNVLILKQVEPADGTAAVWRIDDIDLLDSVTFRSAIAGAFAY